MMVESSNYPGTKLYQYSTIQALYTDELLWGMYIFCASLWTRFDYNYIQLRLLTSSPQCQQPGTF